MVAFVNATIVSTTDGFLAPEMTVIVDRGIIVAVGPVATTPVPANAHHVDARDRFLLPGLVDMHVHLRQADLPRYVAAGITTVRNMWGLRALPAMIHRIDAGELLGPRVYSASPGVDGPPGMWPETRFLTIPDSADALVREFVAAGWKYVKSYNALSKPAYFALTMAAAAHGLHVVGHIPIAVTLQEALDHGQLSIEHLGGYEGAWGTGSALNESLLQSEARETAAHGAWNCPTLGVLTGILTRNNDPNRDRITTNRRAVVRALRDAGARLLVGTDAGFDFVAPGTSYRTELEAMASAGLTTAQVLRAATIGAAEFLGVADSAGVIAPGRWADVVLLDANPLRELATVATPAGVLLRGEWLPRNYLRTVIGR
jgi:imidazolonepropionase-like amidohydrolase